MTGGEPYAFLQNHDEEFLADLRTLLAQPSISATGEGIETCAAMVREYCLEYGFDDAEIVETPGRPAVIAHARGDVKLEAGAADADDSSADTDDSSADTDDGSAEGAKAADRPTILLYGHYDVQPADPDEWTSPPFEPTIREGPNGTDRIYARGAGDNKGQWFAHLCAIRALRETTGLPVDVVLLVEGEEESGSEHLEWLVRERRAELAADLAFVADGPIDASGRPHVLLGARGLLYVDLEATGANVDLHSGNFGGPVPSPTTALIEALASVRDADGRVTIEGFYDDVRPLSDRDREILEAIPVDEDDIKTELGLSGLATDPGEGYVERLLTRPNFNVAGFQAGYGGEGMKTVLPSRATAKVDFRLVADQDPDAVFDSFAAHLHERMPPGVDLEIDRVAAMAPQRTPADSPVVEPVVRAVTDGWEEPILKPALGGSVPTYVFADELGAPCVVVPYANADENNHAPDENIELSCFRAGCRTTAALLTEFGDVSLE